MENFARNSVDLKLKCIIYIQYPNIETHKIPIETIVIYYLRISQPRLVEGKYPGLLVHEEHVAMKAGEGWRTSANIRRQSLASSHVPARNVADQPMVPFTVFRVSAGGRVGV